MGMRSLQRPQKKHPIFGLPTIFIEAKKGVVHCARLRKAAHWPAIINANPSGLSEKKGYCVKAQRSDMCDP